MNTSTTQRPKDNSMPMPAVLNKLLESGKGTQEHYTTRHRVIMSAQIPTWNSVG